MRTAQLQRNQSGFTLIEVIVSTAIFVIVVVAMLSLFNYTLKINRRVQALREVAQGTRTFTETLTREIRNGRIDYNQNSGTWAPECDAANYDSKKNTSLGLITKSGDELCFYLDANNNLLLKKLTTNGQLEATVFGSTRFRIVPETFSFFIIPRTDPMTGPNFPGIQPLVTIVAQFELNINETTGPTFVKYQTTISTDIYDVPHKP